MIKAGQNTDVADFVISTTAGEALAALDAVYIDPADGKAYKCNAGDQTKLNFVGFAQEAAALNAAVLVRNSNIMPGFSSLTIGAIYYLSTTAGQVTATPPTNAVIAGVAVTASAIRIFDGFSRIVKRQYTTSSTWTKRPGLAFIEVEVQAAGAGGWGSNNQEDAPGGGAGAWAKKLILVNTLGATETVTVGVKGDGGSVGIFTPTAGGNSSFGAHVTCTGGGIGSGTNGTGGVGGTATGGDINIDGQQGGHGSSNGGTSGGFSNGDGGSSPLGFGGRQQNNNGGGFATGYGAGGAGGSSSGSADRTGGNGTPGIVIVTEYYV